MDITAITGITFDAAGTLLTPHPSVGAVYAEVISNHGVTIQPMALNALFKVTFARAQKTTRENLSEDTEFEFWRNIVWQTVGPYCKNKDFEQIFKDLFETFTLAKRWNLTEDALPTLQSLKTRGYRLALLTNWDKRIRSLNAEIGLDDLFESIFISSEIGFEKPDRRIFSHVEKKMRLQPNNLLHIGDNPVRDADGAIKAGWNALIFDPDNQNHGYYRITRLGELLSLLPNRS
jgi:putative hydrolase of the HAD superfamily